MRTLTILATGIAVGMAVAVWALGYDDDIDDDTEMGDYDPLGETP